MEKIKDTETYLQKMRPTIINKLFWMNYIYEPISQLVDVGCADCSLLKAFNALSPDTELIGVENNPEMLEDIPDNITVYSSLSKIKKLKENSVLNLSSVLHEVYSYGDQESIKKFWHDVLRLKPTYITIRDMWYPDSPDEEYIKFFLSRIRKSEYGDKFEDFERVWGPVTCGSQLCHFMLKYNYDENWERELKENYLSWSIDDVYDVLQKDYLFTRICSQSLPYLRYKTTIDFGVKYCKDTHVELIFQRMQGK